MLSASTSTEEVLPVHPSLDQDPRPTTFNLHNTHHQALLREWCHDAWFGTIKKSIDSGNPVVYHECCFCFSRRAFSKKANHNAVQSSSVQRIPSFKSVESPEELMRWLLDKLRTQQKLGRRTVFPSINRYHTEEDSQAEDTDQEISCLTKRVQRLDQDLVQAHQTITQLQRDNQCLLKSSRSWFAKYQELLLNKPNPCEDQPSPQKHYTEEKFLLED